MRAKMRRAFMKPLRGRYAANYRPEFGREVNRLHPATLAIGLWGPRNVVSGPGSNGTEFPMTGGFRVPIGSAITEANGDWNPRGQTGK